METPVKANITIEQMNALDTDAVYQIATDCFSDSWSKEEYQNGLDRNYIHSLVAKKDNIVVGYCILSLIADEGEIQQIAVEKSNRCLKIGNRLLKHAISFGKEHGMSKLFLEVRSSNEAAKSLYKNNGFENIGIRKAYYSDNGEDAIIMQLLI